MQINRAKKIVIKLGSSTIVDDKGNFKKKYEIISVIADKSLINLRKLLLKNAGK